MKIVAERLPSYSGMCFRGHLDIDGSKHDFVSYVPEVMIDCVRNSEGNFWTSYKHESGAVYFSLSSDGRDNIDICDIVRRLVKSQA